MVTHLTKTFKDEPSSPRTFRMSKEETLQRIKQVEAQIRTMKEEAEREREATLRNARREALELTEQVQEKAEARYREIVSAAEGEIESEREKLLAAAREDAARMVAQGKANVDRAVDLVVHHGEDDTFRIGKPLAPAAELSDNLVKLRSIASILAIKAPPKEKERIRIEELRQKVLSLELNISEEDAARKKAEGLLGDLERRIDELRPFASIGLPLDAYRGYESLTAIVGRVARDIPGFEEALSAAEVFRGPGMVAVFVPKASSDQALSLLGPSGFTQMDIPAGEGSPRALLDAAVADRDKWKARLEEIQGRLEKMRERYAAFVVAAEEALEVEVDKAEARS